jgi:class 3 adenylate cyclase
MKAIRELEHYGLVRGFPPQGSDLDLTATYRGIVWDTRRAPENAVEPEVAHVLFTDIVGYSKLPMDMQTKLRAELRDLVRGTDTYRIAQMKQKLISRSTGDGIALIFLGHPAAAVNCAIEISRALRMHPEIKLRMGAHTGLIRRDEDINHEIDVAGGGINFAQRVMDAGAAGHILISKAVVDNLEQLGGWSNNLHDLGEIEVKHGARVHIFNLYSQDFGNPETPAKPRSMVESLLIADAPASASQQNIRLAITKEINVNLDLLREIWNRVLDCVRFSPNHPLARVQKGDAIRALLLPTFKRDKWDRLLSEAASILSKDEFEKVDRFYSRLERLQDQRGGDPDRWRVEAELIISDLVGEGNPLKR